MCLAIGKLLGALGALLATLLLLLSLGGPHHETETSAQTPPIRALVLTGESNHDWKGTSLAIRQILESRGDTSVELCDDPDHAILSASEVLSYDVLVLNFNKQQRWSPDVEAGFERFLDAGKGVLVIHAANNSFASWPKYERLIGAAWRSGTYHPPYGRFLVMAKDPSHPIMAGIHRFETTDELYSNLRDYPEEMNLLAYAESPNSRGGRELAVQPVIWTTRREVGRVFHITLGHDVAAMNNGYFIEILQRACAWAAGRL